MTGLRVTALILVLPIAGIGFSVHAAEAVLQDGWTEVVACVSDLAGATALYEKVAGWQVQHHGPLDRETLTAWGLSRDVNGEQVLLGLPEENRGHLRLVHFPDLPAEQIRSSAQAWDTGGFFDMTVMVSSMEDAFRAMQRAGWHGYSEPIEGRAGPLHFSKVRMRGTDGIVMALIERIAPPLEGWPDFSQMSHPFSVSLVTADYPDTRRFYEETLGLEVYLEGHGRPEKEGPTLSGFPLSLSDEIGGHYVIMRPTPVAAPAGRIEILAYDVTGRDLAARAKPPNYGLFALRYPVSDVMTAAEQLTRRGAQLVYEPRELLRPPFGKVTQFAIATPHGGWIEIYQPHEER